MCDHAIPTALSLELAPEPNKRPFSSLAMGFKSQLVKGHNNNNSVRWAIGHGSYAWVMDHGTMRWDLSPSCPMPDAMPTAPHRL